MLRIQRAIPPPRCIRAAVAALVVTAAGTTSCDRAPSRPSPPTASAAAESASLPNVIPAADRRPAGIPPGSGQTQMEMRNVDFYVDPAIPLHVRRLRGVMRSKNGGPVIFDDKQSFIIQITAAEVGLSSASLAVLLNKYVFGYPGAPLSHLGIKTAGTEIIQTGRLHKGVDVSFEIRAALDVTPEGMIRIHPTHVKLLGIGADRLRKALGLSLQKIVDLRGARGATVKGDDILLDPEKILPPPTIEGRMTAIRVEGDEVVQTFGTDSDRAALRPLGVGDPRAQNFMFYRGGTLRFGKLFMVDADMQIVDLDPADAFRFDLDRYQAQLVAGYSRSQADGGLEVFMRDVDKTSRRAPSPVGAQLSRR
jgi:hypothetical protein